MVKTIQESEANLRELVERASLGEDVTITVDGEAKARLTSVSAEQHAEWLAGKKARIERTRALAKAAMTGKPGKTCQEILDEMREDRL